MPLNVLVIISPQKGKEERCRNLMNWVSNEVKENEPDTSAYACFAEEGDDGQGLEFYVYFEYGYSVYRTDILFATDGSSLG